MPAVALDDASRAGLVGRTATLGTFLLTHPRVSATGDTRSPARAVPTFDPGSSAPLAEAVEAAGPTRSPGRTGPPALLLALTALALVVPVVVLAGRRRAAPPGDPGATPPV